MDLLFADINEIIDFDYKELDKTITADETSYSE
jgi:hypothetical protein